MCVYEEMSRFRQGSVLQLVKQSGKWRGSFPHCSCVILFPGSVIKPALTLALCGATVWLLAWHPLIQSTVTDYRPWQRLRLYNSLWVIMCDLHVSFSALCSCAISCIRLDFSTICLSLFLARVSGACPWFNWPIVRIMTHSTMLLSQAAHDEDHQAVLYNIMCTVNVLDASQHLYWWRGK